MSRDQSTCWFHIAEAKMTTRQQGLRRVAVETRRGGMGVKVKLLASLPE